MSASLAPAPHWSPRNPHPPLLPMATGTQRPHDVSDFLRHIQSSRVPAIDEASPLGKRWLVPISALRSYLTQGAIRKLLACYFNTGTAWRQVSKEYLIVFTILVYINKGPWLQFFLSNPSLADKNLPFTHCHNWRTDCHEFFEEFVEAQWQFCAHELRVHALNETLIDERAILPIKSKRPLKEGPDSFAYEIEIYPDYNYLTDRDEHGHPVTNTFFLKACAAENAEYHHKEVEAYKALADQDDVLPYIAHFYGSWIQGRTYCMLMEFVGGGTLTQFMEGTELPTQYEDIMSFWTGLLDLAKPLMRIHSLPHTENGRPDLQGIHHDIKPDNILVTSRTGLSKFDVKFKLADLGLTDFDYVQKRDGASKNNHGTQMFAPPELCVAEGDMFLQRTVLEARPSKDIWALGCVLSEAATWMVLGRESLGRYRLSRAAATQAVPALHQTAYTGCFHDGTQVLQVVRTLHMQICKQRRRNDYVTERVIDLVGDMLGDVQSRPSAVQVYQRAQNALLTAREVAKGGPTNDDGFPYPDIFKTPQTPLYDRREPPERPPEVNITGLGVGFSPYVNPLPAIANPGGYRISGALPPLATAASASGHKTNTEKHVSLPTVDSNRSSIFSSSSASTSHPHQPAPTMENHYDHRMSESNLDPRDLLRITPQHQPHILNGKVVSEQQRSALPSQLENGNSPSPSKNSFKSLKRSSQTSNGRTKLPEITIPEVEEWIRRAKITWNTPHLSGDGWLKRLNGMDQIFLFDDSISMKTHWDDAKRTFSALGYILKEKDPDGMEIRSTNDPSFSRRSKNRGPLLRCLNNFQLGGQCDIGRSLGKILKELHPDNIGDMKKHSFRWRKQKWGVSIYVLTDGVWEDGDEWLTGIVEPIKKLVDSGMQKGQLGIQFIQFGSDPDGTERLRTLDDQLSNYGVTKDFIDTEPFGGNVYKMLLGSIDPAFDRHKPGTCSIPATGHSRQASADSESPPASKEYKV